MDRLLENYLEQIDRHLRPMPASEWVDIVQEIKSELLELAAFILSLVSGGLLLAAGLGCWRLTVGFIRMVSRKRRALA